MKRFSLLASGLIGAMFVTYVSCGVEPPDGNEVLERTPGTSATSWQDKGLVDAALGKAQAVRINSRTNMITYYSSGKPVAKWKVATARPGKETPKGIFAIHFKDVCPSWSKDGVTIAGCASDNPLGKKALWFNEGFIYGMHGVNLGAIDSVTSPNPRDRDRSAGCVRNHPENIEWLFQRTAVGTPVVVGLWDSDPAVADCSGNAALCSRALAGAGSSATQPAVGGEPVVAPNPNPTLPQTFPTSCEVNISAAGVANLRTSASTSSAVAATLPSRAALTVTGEVAGENIAGSTRWFNVTATETGTKGLLHSSLLDCAAR